ncbi:sodium-coupled monocarboxylate transporter 1-like isoform X2 [Lycorma delicatula]
MHSANNMTENEGNFTSALLMFNWIEYLVFSLMLGLSALVGVYYGCYKGNQDTVSEYMQGGKKMGVFPITMSLIASHISGITLLGVPAEVYSYGTQYIAVLFSNFIITVVILKLYLPLFYKLQLNSPYEYLERRFNHSVRMMTSFIFAISLILYIPVVIYVPALAFNQVTGMSIHTITPIVCVICIFYTTLGGLKAVVWTDALQSVFTFGSVIFIMVVGCIAVGGPANVFKVNSEGHRLELFNMDPDPFARNTFWTVTVGFSVLWISYLAIHPGAIQRFTAVPTYNDAVKVIWWFAFGMVVIKTTTVGVGLLIYTRYHDCDPVATKVIRRSGQILPFYVMDVAGQFPGLTGLFISGVVSAALSTMSAGLNTVAGTIYEDFVMMFCAKRHTDARASFIMKVIVVILGLICVFMVFIIEKLGGLVQMAVSLSGLTNGSLIFIFAFGILFPWGTSKGALAGLVSSMVSMGWIAGGAQSAIAGGRMLFPGKITSVNGCPSNETVDMFHNFTQSYEGVGSPVITDGTVPLVYQLSYLYYAPIGVLIGFVVGIIVSLITGTQDLNSLDPDLIATQLHRFLPEKQNTSNVPVKNDYILVKLKNDNEKEQIS